MLDAWAMASPVLSDLVVVSAKGDLVQQAAQIASGEAADFVPMQASPLRNQ